MKRGMFFIVLFFWGFLSNAQNKELTPVIIIMADQLRAGMQAVVIKTYHTIAEFSHLPNILMAVDDYTDPVLQSLFK